MIRYTILMTVLFLSAAFVIAADKGSSKIFYEKYLPDGRIVKILKTTSFKKYPKPKKPELPKEWPENMIAVVSPLWRIDNYSMIILHNNSKTVTVWKKEIRTPETNQAEPPNKLADFKIHDIQAGNDRIAILFSENKVTLEVVDLGSHGVYKVLSSKCLASRQSETNPSSIIKGKIIWLYDELYIILKTFMRGTEIWMLKGDKLIKVSDAKIY